MIINIHMFFGKVEMLAYADEDTGKKALAAAAQDEGGMHPEAHRYWAPPLPGQVID
jgi:hypothetical protein